MAEQQPSNVDQWLEWEIPHIRQALESASRYFDENDSLTVNTLEAVYGQESSFGTMMGLRGSSDAVGHFHLKPETAKEYGLSVSKNNDQRFDTDRASSAAARYLKDLDTFFSKNTELFKGLTTVAVKNSLERYKFVLAAYNGGQGRVADAQHRAETVGKSPYLWTDVEKFLESKYTKKSTADQMREYVEKVALYEAEFASKSPADKTMKSKEPRKGIYRCADGHWRTIDDRPVFICD
ncbi:MAG: transglycosylase SLT domain-containing protein [Candidatus Omnitrophota bacterium]|nr:transglycosylase SLT domain-containing protein [Candidatus Omnitrophota bacterium]